MLDYVKKPSVERDLSVVYRHIQLLEKQNGEIEIQIRELKLSSARHVVLHYYWGFHNIEIN